MARILKNVIEGKSGAGTVKIDIKSSFGNIMIGEGTKSRYERKEKSQIIVPSCFLYSHEKFLLLNCGRIFF